MITSDGWLDWAERVPGHLGKVNEGVNPVGGIFLHSADGFEEYLRTNPGQDRTVGGDKSWHLSNLFSGRLLQHYPLTARCWHATAANQSYVGMEHEGKLPEHPSLTPDQTATSVRVIREISQHYDWAPTRPVSTTDVTHTLWEHNEVTRLGGSGSDCPSGRILWTEILGALDSVPPEEPASPAPALTMYAVAAGDTLTSLARLWRCTVQDIVELNSIANPDQIQIGQVLVIPVRN